MENREDDVSRSSHLLVLASAAAIGGFLYWASEAEIDQITRAPGQVIASSRNQVIQELDGGIVKQILVKEGSVVRSGQPLVLFDRSKPETSYLESRAKAAALKAAQARLRAEVYGGQPQFPPELEQYPVIRANQEMLFKARQRALHEDLETQRQSLGLINTELKMLLPLLEAGDVSKAEVLKLQRQVAEVEGAIASRRNKYAQESQAELSKSLEELAALEQIMAQRRDQLGRTVVTSPTDGVVRNIRITTRGGVAKPGEEIMQIVPVDDDLLIEAKVKPADIAFVKPGLPATIKLDAYDYTLYGALEGVVTYISVDTLNDEVRSYNEPPYYRVQVKTRGRDIARRAGRRIEIQPGMTAAVEIKTGSNTVLRYLTKPITKTLAESLGER
jgi:adhesin transport system membrane fusion protein